MRRCSPGFDAAYHTEMTSPRQSHRPVARDVRRRFDRAAQGFDGVDFVYRVTRDGLLARLAPVVIEAHTVVDLGAATGAAARTLGKRFRGARIVNVDFSRPMLEQARLQRRFFRRPAGVQADARALPFADAGIDVVFSNLMLPWIDDPAAVFSEVARVLRKDGLFAFASLGPDSLLELRRAWQSVSEAEHVNRFIDMHDLGDALVHSGLRDPVLDVDRLSVSYRDARSLLDDLTAMGARNSLAGRPRALTGKQRFSKMLSALFSNGELVLDLELVYGHCWGRGSTPPGGAVQIDAASIPVRRR